MSEVDVNKNVNWLNHPSVWAWYLALVLLGWLGISALLDDAGLAWTYVHLVHGVVTYYLLHWSKGSPCSEDQGKYEYLTFWEQMDGQKYGTLNRKLFTVVPAVLYFLTLHGTDTRKQPLGLNLVVALVVVLAKFPVFHRVRILGINRW